jgi:glycosyltransferase involved in cell wall biosynthesis
VCAILLTRDRPEMARRAVESFRRQTYAKTRLIIWNTGERLSRDVFVGEDILLCEPTLSAKTIGTLRNEAIFAAGVFHGDIILHMDDDDVSHPNRIAEQVALLQASGAECVGYREALFWRKRTVGPSDVSPMERTMPVQDISEVWLYSVASPSWVIGASLCYWRKTWLEHPFPDLPRPGVQGGSTEDVVWRRGVKCLGVSGMNAQLGFMWEGGQFRSVANEPDEPRLICSIHGGNTMAYEVEKYPDTWKRVPQWDDYCRRKMAL